MNTSISRTIDILRDHELLILLGIGQSLKSINQPFTFSIHAFDE